MIPRWEWRTFGDSDDPFSALEPEKVEESDEVYLLSTASDASVKIRDSKLDVKPLQSVDDDGLEQWKPVLKAAFPLGRDDIAALLEALGLEAPPVDPQRVHARAAVDELVGPTADLLAVEVHKQRRPLHGRRLHGGGLRDPHRARCAANDRRRVGGCRLV